MKYKFVGSFSLILILVIMHFTSVAQVKIGVFADCQYCNCETAGTRFYRNSLSKLDDCITQFNRDKEIDFVVGLGDIIDRDFASFDSVNTILAKSKKEIFQVIGNHDLEVEKSLIEKVPSKLNLEKTWYSFTKKGWHFIFLNGNDITFHSNDTEVVRQAKEMTDKLKKEGKPNPFEWNGGIGSNQLEWLEKEFERRSGNIGHNYPAYICDIYHTWQLEKLRSEPRLLALLEKMGLSDYNSTSAAYLNPAK